MKTLFSIFLVASTALVVIAVNLALWLLPIAIGVWIVLEFMGK